ncbi:DUF2459 domain-containing protein [Cupriavidus malaysiensis]|uniref:DUF2459 domain-containing protein n=1 Tax=Cupriavidus malaysiensis TaxID=367825 RepID=A0ABN4TYW0_9BURK|nr:DUF2459 domain-containing protein [Cupriavidus malaysiensis]AOZ09874.1 hypothetical protein BKK80_29740 [Cupriavidus malaysiensis]
MRRNGPPCPTPRPRLLALAMLLLAGCASAPPPVPGGPPVTRIAVIARGWHTDICLAYPDAGERVRALASGFDGARFLCFGFGERQFVMAREHGVLATLSALLPSRAALLMTVLNAPPEAAFGAREVVNLEVGEKGLDGLQAYLRASVQDTADGQAMRLGDGPYPGSVFFAATGTYDAFFTCNTWTAEGLRAAALPVDGNILLSGTLMRQARGLARQQAPALAR